VHYLEGIIYINVLKACMGTQEYQIQMAGRLAKANEKWYRAFQVACNCISSHVIKPSQLIGQLGHLTASAVCKQPEKHGTSHKLFSAALCLCTQSLLFLASIAIRVDMVLH
jgi:hypothetical protein